jgi:hypothetical protein
VFLDALFSPTSDASGAAVFVHLLHTIVASEGHFPIMRLSSPNVPPQVLLSRPLHVRISFAESSDGATAEHALSSPRLIVLEPLVTAGSLEQLLKVRIGTRIGTRITRRERSTDSTHVACSHSTEENQDNMDEGRESQKVSADGDDAKKPLLVFSSPPLFCEGDRVLTCFYLHGRLVWFPGQIAHVHSERLYDVAYDDGDFRYGVWEDEIISSQNCNGGKFSHVDAESDGGRLIVSARDKVDTAGSLMPVLSPQESLKFGTSATTIGQVIRGTHGRERWPATAESRAESPLRKWIAARLINDDINRGLVGENGPKCRRDARTIDRPSRAEETTDGPGEADSRNEAPPNEVKEAKCDIGVQPTILSIPGTTTLQPPMNRGLGQLMPLHESKRRPKGVPTPSIAERTVSRLRTMLGWRRKWRLSNSCASRSTNVSAHQSSFTSSKASGRMVLPREKQRELPHSLEPIPAHAMSVHNSNCTVASKQSNTHDLPLSMLKV